MWYTETEHQGITPDHRSLTIAFANLLAKTDSDYQPTPTQLYELLTSDDPVIDWWSVAEYVEDLEIHEIGAEGADWPPTSTAVVKFRRMDEAVAGPVDHYCLVADHRARSIVDSLDGVIKSSAIYGTLLGWASYVSVPPNPEEDARDAELLAAAGAEPNTYVLQPGENIWDAARKLNLNVEALIDLNELHDPRLVKAGFKLHLPIRKAEEKRVVRYEVLDDPVPMHVSKAGGTTKYAFGNATKWAHISAAGRIHAQNSNHLIMAIAHVHLEDEETTAAYYMDRIDFGNFELTGRPQFLTGFNHSHLSEGHVELVPEPTPAPIVEADVAAAALQEDERVPAKTMDVIPPTTAPASSHVVMQDYHNTLVPLKDDESPILFMAEETIAVHEAARRRPSRPLNKGQSVRISHTFEKDNILYGLPAGTKDAPFWFGIPMDKVISEEELYNFNIPLSERLALRSRLTVQERGVVLLSRVLSQGTRLRVLIKNKQGAK